MDFGPYVQQVVESSRVPLLAAFLVGLVAAVGPCPLATNLAALTYTAQQFQSSAAVLLSGMLYAAGRAAGYALVGAVILLAGAAIGRVAGGLQDIGDVLLGPLLILVGLVLLGAVRQPTVGASLFMAGVRERVAGWRGGGAFALGFLFALAFCPYSATLFFGVLIPMALRSDHGLALPIAFGVGTAMPVLVLGVPLALGLGLAGRGVGALARLERAVRLAAGTVFVLAGLYSLGRLV